MRAVCLECGGIKWGSLTECRACGSKPASLEDQARALLAGEDEVGADRLDALAERVKAGERPQFDSDLLAERIAELEAVPAPPLGWTLLVLGAPFVVLVVLGMLAIAVFSG